MTSEIIVTANTFRVVVTLLFAGCKSGPGGADIQGSVHWQRRHVEAEEDSGMLG